MPKFRDIPQLTKTPSYKVNVSWKYIETWLSDQDQPPTTVELCPDFQRGHVWTPLQQQHYVEFRLRGGESAKEIMWNHPGWQGGYEGALQLVDGLQRLTAAREFMADRLTAFGHYFSEYTDSLRLMTAADFIFYVNDLPTRADVLRWYLEINSGGTPHSDAEIGRVQALLDAEQVAP